MPEDFALSTRIGNRPQAILHPHGNRGADLIETIRLEKMSAAIKHPGRVAPPPDERLFIRPHHSDPRVPPKATRPGVGGPGERPWAERRWNRPASAGQLTVHNREHVDDMLTPPTADGGGAGSRPDSRLSSPLPQPLSPVGATGTLAATSLGSATSQAARATSAAHSAVRQQQQQQQQQAGGRRRPQSAHAVAEMRQRLRAQQEITQERVLRKLKESQQAAHQQQEAEFHRAWEQFQAEQTGVVADIDQMLRLKDIEFVRRANAHCKHWNEEVYEKIAEQVDHQLRKREASGAYNTRWRHAQDEYLRTLAKKEPGVFRDIILEEEYDPLMTANANIRYKSSRLNRRDPLKAELIKHEREARMVPGSQASTLAASAKAHGGHGRECLDVKEWANLEGTPFGHFNKVLLREEGAPPKPLSNSGARVLGDHYTRTTVEPRKPRRHAF